MRQQQIWTDQPSGVVAQAGCRGDGQPCWSHLQAAEGLAEVPHAAPLSGCVLWAGLAPQALSLASRG